MSVYDFWTPFSLEPFLNALIVGLSFAGIWLIAALGLAIIYGTMGVINMAHGEFIMLGAYSTHVLQTYLGFPFLLCLPASFIIVAVIGWVIERGLIRYLYERPLDTLLATWGVALIAIQSVRLIFGPEPVYVHTPDFLDGVAQVGFLRLGWLRLLIIGLSLGLLAITWFIMFRTVMGIRVRAVTQNKEIAEAHGINSSRVYGLTCAYGAGLAGIAGSMFGTFKNVFPDMGKQYIVEAFLVVVVGGVGELFGSLASAVALGEIQSVFSYFTNDTFARFVLFVMVVVLLRFRPQGMFAPPMARR